MKVPNISIIADLLQTFDEECGAVNGDYTSACNWTCPSTNNNVDTLELGIANFPQFSKIS